MAQIGNVNEFTASDGLNTYFNIDTLNKHVQLTNADLSATQSATAPDPGAAGTIATAGIVIARVSPASARTGVILQAGTQPGQVCLVINEGTLGFNGITFDVSGTSHVANGTNEVILGGAQKLFAWDSGTSLWYAAQALQNGTVNLIQSATTPDPGANGTITTSGVGIARVTPAAARAGVILQAGNYAGQLVIVQNEGSLANPLTFDVSGTSHVADGANDVIWGGQSVLFEWNSAQSLWFRTGNPLISGALQPTIASATTPDPGAGGTVNTAGLGRTRVTPAASRTACVLQAGTFDGQQVEVYNEAASFSVSWATAATSNIAGEAGGTFVLAAGGMQLFRWNTNTSRWHKAA